MDPMSHMHPCWIHVMWKVELARAMQDPSFFTMWPPGVSRSQVSSRAVFFSSPLGFSINALVRGDFSTPSSLSAAGNGYPVRPVVRGFTFGRLSSHPIQKVGAKGGTTWELIWGWGILIHPSWLSLSSSNLLYRKDFPVYSWGRHGLSFYRMTDFGLVF